MAWGISAEQSDFEEATAQFQQRVPHTHEQIGKLDDRARAKAFWIAGAVELDAVQAVHDEIVKALKNGTGIEDFKKLVREKLGARLGAGGSRLELVFRNATQTSYNNARWYQMREPDVLRFRPYGMVDAILDQRTTTYCKEVNGTVLPLDDLWWDTHWFPAHHACFPAGTMVYTESGQAPIESLKIGDRVLTHRGRARRVSATMSQPSPERLIKLTCASGAQCVGTATHPALTQRGWVELSALRAGDHLIHVVKASGKGSVVGNPERDDSCAEHHSRASDRELPAGLRHFDADRAIRQEKVDKDQVVALDQRLLENECTAGGCEPAHHSALGLSGLGLGLTMSGRVQQVPALDRGHGAGDDIAMGQTSGCSKLFGNAGQPRVCFLGVALGPVHAGGSALGASPGEAGCGSGCFSVGVSDPLMGDSLGSVADVHAVALQKVRAFVDRADAQLLHHFAQRQSANLVEVSEHFMESISMFTAHSELNCLLEVVAGHEEISSQCPSVFNIEVEDDETYVADGFVVHNCRTSVRNLRKSEAERRGIAPRAPDAMPAPGFGLAPPKQGDGIPKPDQQKYAPDVWAVYKAREAAMQAELAAAQKRAQEERLRQDPAHWLETEYRAKYGEDAGRSVAWGRAMEERGKAVSMAEAKRQYADIQDGLAMSLGQSSTPLFTRLKSAVEDGFLPDGMKTLGDAISALEQAAAKTPSLKPVLDETRALAALVGHRGGIKAAGSAVKLSAPRVHKSAPQYIKDIAPEIVDKVERFWAELSDKSLVLADKRRGYVIEWDDRRARFDHAARIVYTEWGDHHNGFSVIVHEMGHGLEHENQITKRAAEQFLERRTVGESARKLRDITGNDGFRDNEVTKEDKFFNPYVGKDYVDSHGVRYGTEVTSMVLEELHKNAANLVDKDVEAFWFALGQLAGKSAQ